MVNYRLTGLYASRRPEIRRLQAKHASGAERKGSRPVNFGDAGVLAVPVYEREALAPGFHCYGPAIVEEPSSTTLIYPGQRMEVDPYGQLRIHMRAQAAGA